MCSVHSQSINHTLLYLALADRQLDLWWFQDENPLSPHRKGFCDNSKVLGVTLIVSIVEQHGGDPVSKSPSASFCMSESSDLRVTFEFEINTVLYTAL